MKIIKKNTNTKTSLACSNVNTKQYEMKKMPNLFKQNFGGLCIDQCFLNVKICHLKTKKNVSANLTKGFLRKNPTRLPNFWENKIKLSYFDNKFDVLQTHGKNLNFFF